MFVLSGSGGAVLLLGVKGEDGVAAEEEEEEGEEEDW